MRGVTCVVVADGHPVSRPGDPRRLRRTVSEASSWLLWLLRPAATPKTATLIPLLRRDGMSDGDVDRVFSTFNVTRFTAERNKQ